MSARKLLIRGRVQGVGFRDAMVDAARSGSLAGFVRNAADGSVEARVQGDDDAVARVIAWASDGPSHAHVERVLVEAIEHDPTLRPFRRS
ncbi:MAG: acylphosphatase [Betaproteobacteria bacterium]